MIETKKMENLKTECLTFINKNIMNIRIKSKEQKFKNIKIALHTNDDIKKFENCKYKIEKEEKDDKVNYYLMFNKDNNCVHIEQIYLLNVKYYLTNGPCHKRNSKKPYYSYIEKTKVNLDDIKSLITREKLNYIIEQIKIKTQTADGKIIFENVSDNKEYNFDKSGYITLEFHYNRIKEKNNLINDYRNKFGKLYTKFNKFSEKSGKHDLIYLYASPLAEDDKGTPIDVARICYREEIKIIYDLMKKKKKKLDCLFKCASDKVLKDTLANRKTKILQISSHGINYDDVGYNIILENLEKYGQKQIENRDNLKIILENNSSAIKNIDLIILLTCHSEGFQELFVKGSPKYIIYVDKKCEIGEPLCLKFSKYFYSELLDGNSINESFINAKKKLYLNSDILSKNLGEEIEKIKIYKRDSNVGEIRPFLKYEQGNISINENVKINFNPIKYRSIIGRIHIIIQVIKDLRDSNNINQFIIIYGKAGLEKLNLAESLCVYLFERQIIANYEIFNQLEIDDNIDNTIKCIEAKIIELQRKPKYINKKIIIIIKIEQKEFIKTIKSSLSKYKNFYFVIIINKEYINIEENNNCFNAILNKDNAKSLFLEICSSYGLYINKSKNDIIDNFPSEVEKILKNQNEQYTFAEIREYADLYISYLIEEYKKGTYSKSNDTGFAKYIQNKKEKLVTTGKFLSKEKEIKIELTPFFAYLFLLSKMPLGLPDCFVQLIFNKLFDEKLINIYKINTWNFINTDTIFVDGKDNKDNTKIINYQNLKEYSMEYMIKALKVYYKILYYYIEKDRIKIKYPDENIHFIFNSYNNEGIWKSNIPDIRDDFLNKINENEFIDSDFNINNHIKNIYNLIKYLTKNLYYFDEASIDYLIEILLLFPSYFFLKKSCKRYIIQCREFCRLCEKYYEDKKKPELQIKFNEQNARLFLFLYSISSKLPDGKENFPNDKRFQLELNILKYIKNEKNDLEDILVNNNPNQLLTLEKKFIIYYILAAIDYSEKANAESSEFLLNQVLSFASRNKFLKHRINIDLCYIFLESIKKKENGEDSRGENKISFVNVVAKKISLLDELMANIFNKKLYDEESRLRQKLFDLIEPNIIMLNANPLNNGFCLLSSGINAKYNNQYYIMDALNEKGRRNQIESNIRMMPYILNKKNLKEALEKDGEILIIQSDDYTEEGDIILESDDGISKKLNKEEFNSLFSNESKKIHFKVILLCFFNSYKYIDIIKNKINFEYLVYFEEFKHFFNVDNAFLKAYNQHMVEMIIEIVSSYKEDNIYNIIVTATQNFNKSFQTIFYFPKCCFIKNDKNSILEIKEINPNNNGIFFFSPFLNLPTSFNIQKEQKYDVLNNYSNEILKLIYEIKIYKQKECYCNITNKDIYIKIGFEIIKFFYRHKIFFQFYCLNMENGFEMELIDEKDNRIKMNKKFYLIYNCKYYNSLEIVNYLLKNDISYMIIYDKEDNFYLENEEFKKLNPQKDIDYYYYYQEKKNEFSAFEYKFNDNDSDPDDDYID